jgi:hypothetical protein
MLIGLRDRGIDIALIMFADTRSEKPETTAYLPMIDAWLQRQGMPLIHRLTGCGKTLPQIGCDLIL